MDDEQVVDELVEKFTMKVMAAEEDNVDFDEFEDDIETAIDTVDDDKTAESLRKAKLSLLNGSGVDAYQHLKNASIEAMMAVD